MVLVIGSSMSSTMTKYLSSNDFPFATSSASCSRSSFVTISNGLIDVPLLKMYSLLPEKDSRSSQFFQLFVFALLLRIVIMLLLLLVIPSES